LSFSLLSYLSYLSFSCPRLYPFGELPQNQGFEC